MNLNPIASIRQHLALKILVPLALLFVFASAAGVAAIGTLFNQHLEQQLVDRGLLVALTLKDAAKSISSEKNLQNFVANLSQQKDIDFIVIAGDSPLRVIACSDDSLVGKPIEVLPKEDFINDLNSAIHRDQQSVEFDQGGGTLLDVSAPIGLPHLSPHQKGALMIHLHTTPLKAATNNLKQQMSIGFLVGLGTLLIALMLIIKQWILKPLHQILTTTDARNTGHKVFSQVSTQDEFLKLSNAFNEMVRSGDEVELQKNRFVATVSHELRTPLTSIKGGLTIVLNQYEKTLDLKAREMLNIALRNTDRLRAIINDLLDMEKINADQLTLDKNLEDLAELIPNALADCENYASARKVSFEFKTELPHALAIIDSARIQQVLLNLLSNAAKFSPEYSKIQVTLEQHDGHFRTSVKDYGCGIPESFYGDIFKSFKQADNSSSRTKGGTGLGLAISNKLLALHGTTLEFTSVVNQGTCFFFDIEAAIINDTTLNEE